MRKRRQKMVVSASGSVLSLLAGLAILFLTFWFVYAIIWIANMGISSVSELLVNKRLAFNHGWRLALSGVFVLLLFIENARTSREYLSDYPREDYPAYPDGPAVFGGGLALGWLLAHPQASSKMISDILFSGPRCIMGAFEMGQRFLRLAHIDLNSFGDVLRSIAVSNSSVSREQLPVTFDDSQWHDFTRDLCLFDGVLFLGQNPVRLSMTQELRGELRAIADH